MNMNDIMQEYLNTPENERSLTQLSKKYNVSRKTITKFLVNNGVKIVNYQNRCRIDETVFDIIDTDEKAYWLGFLYADGCVVASEKRLELNLAAKDEDHMLKFKNFLKSVSPIRKNICTNNKGTFEMCRFGVRNVHVFEQLVNKGCIPNKTLLLKFPKTCIFAEDKLKFAFIRGYFDGDGTIGLYKLINGCRHFNVRFAGMPDFLKGVEACLGIKGRISHSVCNGKAYQLCYTGAKARKVARIMYENASVYMERKHNIFNEFCRAEEESSVLQSSKIGESCDANPEVTSEIAKGLEVL